jgi:hypothetical protein
MDSRRLSKLAPGRPAYLRLTPRLSVSSRTRLSEADLFAVAAGFDLLLWCAVVLGRMGLTSALVVHVGIVGSATLVMWATRSGDRSLAGVGIPCLLIAGPLGGVGAVVMMQILSRMKDGSHRLASWYEQLSAPGNVDAPSELHERLAAGRVARPVAADIKQFVKIMRKGSDREQQIVLGFIGLRYNPDYLHALHLALASPQASIRVQAAAVFTKLRARYKALLKQCLGRCGEAGLKQQDMLEITRGVLEALESGFLDPSETRQAQSTARSLCQKLEQAKIADIPDNEVELLACRLLALEDQHEVTSARLTAPLELTHSYMKSHRSPGQCGERQTVPNYRVVMTIPEGGRPALRAGPPPPQSLRAV